MENKKALAAYGSKLIFERFEANLYNAYASYSNTERLEWVNEMFGAMGVFLTLPNVDEDALRLFLLIFEDGLIESTLK